MDRTAPLDPRDEAVTRIDVSTPGEGDPFRDRTRRQAIPLRSPYYDPFSAETRRVPSPIEAPEAAIPLVRVLRQPWVRRLPDGARAALEAARLGHPLRPTARVTRPLVARSPRIPSLER